jgi:hypothetical protein
VGWEEGAGFRIVGCVKRVFVADSGKFAKLTVDVQANAHAKTLELKCFDRSVIGDIRALRQGQRVQVRGKVESEKVTDRARNEVKVDGYALWIPALRPTSVEVEGSSRAPAPRKDLAAAAPTPSPARESGGDDDAFAPSGGFDGDGELP